MAKIMKIKRGRIDPITQAPARSSRTVDVEIVSRTGGRVKIKTPGCYPPDGFTVSREHYAALWASPLGDRRKDR